MYVPLQHGTNNQKLIIINHAYFVSPLIEPLLICVPQLSQDVSDLTAVLYLKEAELQYWQSR